ncbi:hypothetical protein BURC_02297 [Burkholderiaceae bacterium]|nr:hypothetical protein BURC_02297 [Burkholderiaceae bacterium]
MTSIELLAEPIERIEPPSLEVFRRRYLQANRPVVLAGGVRHWKAASTWSMDYLKTAIGDTVVPVEVSSTGRFPADVTQLGFRDMSVGEYIDSAILKRPAGERFYLSQTSIPDVFPRLMDDIELPPYLQTRRSPRLNLWFGSAGTQTQLHYDDSHNLFAQLHGRKQFLLFAPNDSGRLYRYPLKHWYAHFSQIDTARPDFARFPRFEDATPIQCTLEPGDALFLPAFWWHQPRCVDTSISVSIWWSPQWTSYWHYRQFHWQLGNFALGALHHLRTAGKAGAASSSDGDGGDGGG